MLRFLRGVSHEPPGDRLPRGHHHLSPEYVAAHQRLRILDATTHVVAEMGFRDATVGQIVERARVSRRTFYEHFDSKEHCFLACFGASVECLADAVAAVYNATEWPWEQRMAGALLELGRLVREYPQTAAVTFVEVGAAGREAEVRRARAVTMAAAAVGEAVQQGEQPGSDPPSTRLVAGAIFELVRTRTAAGEADQLESDLPGAARVLLEPLVGAACAGRIAGHVEEGVPIPVPELDRVLRRSA